MTAPYEPGDVRESDGAIYGEASNPYPYWSQSGDVLIKPDQLKTVELYRWKAIRADGEFIVVRRSIKDWREVELNGTLRRFSGWVTTPDFPTSFIRGMNETDAEFRNRILTGNRTTPNTRRPCDGTHHFCADTVTDDCSICGGFAPVPYDPPRKASGRPAWLNPFVLGVFVGGLANALAAWVRS